MKYIGLFLFIVLIGSSCNSDQLKLEEILGEWEIVEAKRNGKLTRTLDNTYFSFLGDLTMKSNLMMKEEYTKFEIHNETVELIGDEDLEFSINRSNDTLFIETKISRHNFDLIAIPKEELQIDK